VAQAFQPAGSGDFPVPCSNDVRIIPESSDVQRFTTRASVPDCASPLALLNLVFWKILIWQFARFNFTT